MADPDDRDGAAVHALLARAGVLPATADLALTPLAGGVSCDVWRVDSDGRPVCVVKRALARLRVAADWFAPVERTESEVRWLRTANALIPHVAPRILATDADRHMFAMEYLPPANHPVWKDELFAGRVDVPFAAAVGRDLAQLHAATAGRADIAGDFATGELFAALRIDPFLRHVAARHPAAAPRLQQLADALAASHVALVHGDVSPKNILMGPDGPVILDAECAVYGDPAFDAAFCTTHLLLKTVHLRDVAAQVRQSALALADAYLAGVGWEPQAQISRRISDLSAALLLARIDGKSPAGYVRDAGEQQLIRAAALARLTQPPVPLPEFIGRWPDNGATTQ